MKELWDDVRESVETKIGVELDDIEGVGETERMATFVGEDGLNYRLTLTQLVPASNTARPGG